MISITCSAPFACIVSVLVPCNILLSFGIVTDSTASFFIIFSPLLSWSLCFTHAVDLPCLFLSKYKFSKYFCSEIRIGIKRLTVAVQQGYFTRFGVYVKYTKWYNVLKFTYIAILTFLYCINKREATFENHTNSKAFKNTHCFGIS